MALCNLRKPLSPSLSSFSFSCLAADSDLLKEAARKERANNVTSTLPVLEDEMELRPINPRLPAGARNAVYYFFLAYQHRLRGSFDRAVVALTRAIGADPTDYRLYV